MTLLWIVPIYFAACGLANLVEWARAGFPTLAEESEENRRRAFEGLELPLPVDAEGNPTGWLAHLKTRQ